MKHRDARSQSTMRLSFEALEPRLALSGTGLTAQYFHNPDFTGLAEVRTEAVAHNWGDGSPAAGVDADHFSVRWTGQILPRYSETYTFRVLSDEGVRVWIGGQLVIDDWTSHTARVRSGSIALEADQLYDMRVDYYEGTGAARVELSWSSWSQPQEVIPASRLYESPAGLLGSYADESGRRVSRVDANIDFDWGLAAPAATLQADRFSATWTGQIRADFSEEYAFSLVSDDGARLWIGGELVIDAWTNSAGAPASGTKMLEAGKWYDLRLEYHDDAGPAQIQLQWSSPRQTAPGTYEVVPQYSLGATERNAPAFTNPLGPGQDPFVIQWNGEYLMTHSQVFNGVWSVWINRAASLEDIHGSSPGSQSVLAWTAPAGTHYSRQVWAPELHRLGNNWYIYVAASDGNNATHRMHVLERIGPDPFGPYTYKGQLAAATDRWAIDGTVLEWQGQLYFVWSGWPGFTDGQQNLYIAEMRNPWTLRGDRVLISSPQYGWEMHGLAINEGPQILKHEDQLHIIYSASGYWTRQYALGRLTYAGVGSLLDPASWTKSPQPVFAATSEVVGVGHASFTKSPDGTEDWMVYHSHANPNFFNENRVVNIQRFTYRADGTPSFGQPAPFGQQLAVPSAGPDPERGFVTGDFNADGIVDDRDYQTWRATVGAMVFAGTSADGSGNGVVDAADYVLWRRHSGDPAATHLSGMITVSAASSQEEVVSSTDQPVEGVKASQLAKDLALAAFDLEGGMPPPSERLRTKQTANASIRRLPATEEPSLLLIVARERLHKLSAVFDDSVAVPGPNMDVEILRQRHLRSCALTLNQPIAFRA